MEAATCSDDQACSSCMLKLCAGLSAAPMEGIPARVCAVGKDLMRCRQSPAVPRPYHPVHGARTLSRGVTPASGHPPMLDHVETGEAGWRDTPACRHGDCCQDVHY